MRTKAILALVFAGLGIVLPVLVPSAVGLVLAIQVRRRPPEEVDPETRNVATVALVLGWIGATLALVGILTFVLLWLFGYGVAGWDCDAGGPLQPPDACPKA